jgi:hypothetical protein
VSMASEPGVTGAVPAAGDQPGRLVGHRPNDVSSISSAIATDLRCSACAKSMKCGLAVGTKHANGTVAGRRPRRGRSLLSGQAGRSIR